MAGGVGFEAMPGVFAGQLARRRPSGDLHVERPDLAACQCARHDGDGPDPGATRDNKVADSPLRKEHLWTLFTSFTRAQYRDQDIGRPWTGEFYNGETGRWKTAERDYNHSTWLDILIPELVGVVPRDDDVLEVDPLLPEHALGHFVLDGLRYHGHDVTIAWDEPAEGSPDHHGDGRKGLDVYVNGRLAASAPGLSRLAVPLAR